MTETVFIGCDNGGIDIYIGAGNKVAGNIKTAKAFKYVFDTYGIDPDKHTIYTTSCVDFADEYGFDHYDGAKVIIDAGFKYIAETKGEVA